MGMTRKGASRSAFLPVGMAEALNRLAARSGGVLLIGLALALAVILATANQADASLDTAVDAPVANALGKVGAVIADLLSQWLGAGAILPVIAGLAWGGHIVARARRPTRWGWRVAALLPGMVAWAVALAAIHPAHALPGPGGAVGRLILAALPAGLAWVAVLAGGLAALVVSAFVVGMGWTQVLVLVSLLGALARRGVSAVTTGRPRDAIPSGGLEPQADPHAPVSPEEVADEPRLVAEAGEETLSNASPEGEEEAAAAVPAASAPERPVEAPSFQSSPMGAPAPSSAPPVVAERQAVRPASAPAPRPAAEIHYEYPPVDVLAEPSGQDSGALTQDVLAETAKMLESVLEDFGVNGKVVKVRPGPVVTLYELEPAPGTKTSRVIGLADDIARSMSALSVRIATVPGRSVIGIELPNRKREVVYLRELLESEAFEKAPARLTLALGKDIGGAPVMVDLARMPHLLIAGTTGSGKSVAVNTMILSLLYRLRPDECRLIMIDPKMLELSVYDGIPHLLAPVVTEPPKAVVALKWAVREMEDRYRAMSQLGVRNIAGYNQRLSDAAVRGETLSRTVQTGFDPETGKPIYEDQMLALQPLPFIVVIVDEMADLMLVAGKDIEAAVQRLAQMARAAGIHLIMATQRPSVDVITGTIKANFPTRISFQVTSKIDSRTILGEQGAEQLLGQGDMLYMAAGGRITRVHGPFVSDQEVEKVVEHLRGQGEPSYVEAVTVEEEEAGAGNAAAGGNSGDELYDQAVALVAREGKASTSFIQRHLQIGYNRAARLIERMEAEGVVSKPNHVGKREVLVRTGREEEY